MAFLADISAGLGVGATGAAFAAGIYGAAIALEKEARPQAKSDIASFLKHLPDTIGISLLARHTAAAFDLTFGERQFSLKCVGRSLIATLALFFLMTALMLSKHGTDIDQLFVGEAFVQPGSHTLLEQSKKVLLLLLMLLIMTAVPDYLALGKSRILIRFVARSRMLWRVGLIMAVDLVLSLVILYGYASMLELIINDDPPSWQHLMYLIHLLVVGYMAIFQPHGDPYGYAAVLLCTSTIITSIWTVLIFLAAAATRLLLKLRYPMRVLTWLYDVDEQPIRIIGLTMAGIVWLGCICYGVL